MTEAPDGDLTFVAGAFQDEPRLTRDSVRRLAAEGVAIACPGHGAPIRGHADRALAELLERDASRTPATQ